MSVYFLFSPSIFAQIIQTYLYILLDFIHKNINYLPR